jgi:hypothetical protein
MLGAITEDDSLGKWKFVLRFSIKRQQTYKAAHRIDVIASEVLSLQTVRLSSGCQMDRNSSFLENHNFFFMPHFFIPPRLLGIKLRWTWFRKRRGYSAYLNQRVVSAVIRGTAFLVIDEVDIECQVRYQEISQVPRNTYRYHPSNHGRCAPWGVVFGTRPKASRAFSAILTVTIHGLCHTN